jgi:hypothetical protein
MAELENFPSSSIYFGIHFTVSLLLYLLWPPYTTPLLAFFETKKLRRQWTVFAVFDPSKTVHLFSRLSHIAPTAWVARTVSRNYSFSAHRKEGRLLSQIGALLIFPTYLRV